MNILFNDAFFIRFYGNALCVDVCLKLVAGDCVRELKMRCSNTKDGILLSKKSSWKNRTSADRKTKLISMPPCREHKRFFRIHAHASLSYIFLSLFVERLNEQRTKIRFKKFNDRILSRLGLRSEKMYYLYVILGKWSIFLHIHKHRSKSRYSYTETHIMRVCHVTGYILPHLVDFVTLTRKVTPDTKSCV